MQRYLLNVSYIGSLFRGITKIEPYYKFGDDRTVQGCLETAVGSVVRKRCEVRGASRTDARVHGLSSYFHFDYDHGDHSALDTLELISSMNTRLSVAKAAIRINTVELVDLNAFDAPRNVFSRSYLYRLAVPKERPARTQSTSAGITFPIEEVDRCHFIKNSHFDVERVKRAAAMLVGKHDFRTFMQISRDEKTQTATYPWRHMLTVSVEEGRPAVMLCNAASCEKHFQYYDVHFTARSYVYRQIRRIIGALVSVAQHRISERDFYEMLTIPSHERWLSMEKDGLVLTAPACGLYLGNIVYKAEEEWDRNEVRMSPRGVQNRTFWDNRQYEIRK